MVDITITMIALLVGVLAVCGGLQAAIPYMMSSRELFAVTVPPIAHTEPEVRRMKRTYALAVSGLTLASIAAVVACGLGHGGCRAAPDRGLICPHAAFSCEGEGAQAEARLAGRFQRACVGD